jgi:hypothetical protein
MNHEAKGRKGRKRGGGVTLRPVSRIESDGRPKEREREERGERGRGDEMK